MRVLALAAVLVLAGPGMLGQVVGSSGGVGVLGVGVNRYSIEARLMARAVKGQPYSLVEKTTLVRVLGDGTTITTVQETRRMRDSEGRERTESGTVVDGKLQISFVTLLDPVAMTSTTLFERSKTARVTRVPASEIEAQEGEARARATTVRMASATENNATGTVEASKRQDSSVERLPPRNIAGVYAEGMKFVNVIAAGKIGNDREIKTVSENWRSPELGIELEDTRDDPQTGKMTMEVTELERAEPDAALFKVPEGYKVIDQPANQ